MIEVKLTDAAVEKIQHFAKSEAKDRQVFRIFVQGGGCSGFEYGFSFDDPQDTDHTLTQGPVTFVVDPYSATYIHQATLDYFEDFRGAGFTVMNPNAKTTCGCGLSFGV